MFERMASLPLRWRGLVRSDLLLSRAEEEGFEPPEPLGSTVFKTAAFDHSATPPASVLF
jgi:hypothetical protein